MKSAYLNSDIPEVPIPVVILRVGATSVLKRSFGFDWTASQTGDFSGQNFSVLSERKMTTLQAVELLDKIGIISCYETIPPEEIEILSDGRYVKLA